MKILFREAFIGRERARVVKLKLNHAGSGRVARIRRACPSSLSFDADRQSRELDSNISIAVVGVRVPRRK